jgi:peptide/nickel transport system substrate-binding protein
MSPRSRLVPCSIPRLADFGAVAVLLLGVCGAAAAAERSHAAKPTLRIGFSFSLATLDPSKNGNGPGNILLDLAYAPLTNWKPDGTIRPGLANSWHFIGSGNKDFAVTLRHDARFSDGSRVTAAAVKASLEYFANNNPTLGSAMGPIRSINTVGQWTV